MRRAALLALLALPGCSTFRTYFPTHEDVFVPVPMTIGEARVVGADTSWVLAEPAYELVASRRELLPDARRALDEAAEQFRLVFGAAPTRVTVSLREDDDEAPAAALPAAGAATEVVPLPLPPQSDRARAAGRPRLVPLAPVVRAWLAAYADRRAGTPRLRSAYAPEAPPADDPRLPDWLEDGVVQLVAGAPMRDVLLAELAEQPARAIALRELLAKPRPARPDARAADDPLVDRPAAGRRALFGDDLEGPRLFAVQSYGVARFLADREGRPILGAMVDRVLAGETALAALAGAKHLTPDVEALEQEWTRWLAEEYRRRR